MRLVNTHSLEVNYYLDNEIPFRYAILSHTWGREEVTLSDMQAGGAEHLHGYRRIQQACLLARNSGYSRIWIDTCWLPD